MFVSRFISEIGNVRMQLVYTCDNVFGWYPWGLIPYCRYNILMFVIGFRGEIGNVRMQLVYNCDTMKNGTLNFMFRIAQNTGLVQYQLALPCTGRIDLFVNFGVLKGIFW